MKLKSKKYFQHKGKVYDLEVNTPDHSYNIDGLTVHNSAAGSTVAWALGITGLNPIEHGLMFERFINPQRKVMADIDWDNEKVSRDMILQYLIEKYGRDSVCNVPTFGTYGAKSALQAMSRGLRKDTGHDTILMKKIAKLEELNDIKLKWDGTKLVDYFKVLRDKTSDDEVRDWIDNNQDTIDYAQKIQGQMNNMGTHAGGIVVTPEPIYNFIPVTRSSSNLVAAYQESDGSAKDLGELGILKLDVLGLSTLDILKDCVTNIKLDTGLDLSEKIQFLDLEDKNLIECFAKGDNYGVFQMERSKMFTSTFEKDGGPVDCFEDIVVINAMNRPGPLEKYLNKYGYWKGIDRGNVKVTPEKLEKVNKERYPFPFMEPILKPTHGAMLYQEQLMKIFCELTGLSFGDADSFRRAIGWTTTHPKYHTVAKYFDAVKDAMVKKGYTEKDIEFFIQYLRDFAGYSFNRSHALCYSYVSFQCLFFKFYYPAYFYAALINNANNIEKIQEIISFAKAEGIKVLPQSVKESIYLTKAVENTTIRLGFGMIKGMGDSTIEACNLFKTFPTMEELLKQKFKGLNKTQYQNLIDLGAFDDFKIDRKQVAILKDFYQDEDIEFWFTRKKQTLRLETIPDTLKALFNPEKCLKIALNAKKAFDDALWDGEEELSEKPWVTLIKELVKDLKSEELDAKKYLKETSKKQKELMGFTLSDSGLASIDSTLKFKGLLPLKEFADASKSYYFIVEKIEKALTKTGKTYLKLTLNDGLKAKCWRDIELVENEVYYGLFKKDNYGYTLSDKDCYKAL